MVHYAGPEVLGPLVRHFGKFVAIRAPGAFAAMLARAALRRVPQAVQTKIRRGRHGADTVLGSFPNIADIRWCARAVARLRPEAVIIDTIFRASLLAEPELKGTKAIIMAPDLFHRRTQAFKLAGYSVQPRDLTRTREATLLGHARAIAAIQPEEAALIRTMCPDAEVFCAPMPALLCPPPATAARIPGRLVFVGSAALPNLDGLRWFLTDIWPQLDGQNITLDILGECGNAMRALPHGVRAHGRVAALAPYLHHAALAIAPLRTGSGLKMKLLDYARHGLTTIATPPAYAGFQPDPDLPFVIAGSASMFASAVVRLAAAPPAPETALAYCNRHYGVEACFSPLRAALTAPGPAPAPRRYGALRL